MSFPYEDIINLPHHVSMTRPQMSMKDRAAQFSPFAALTGFEDSVHETARLTDQRHCLDESIIGMINERIQLIAGHLDEQPEVEIVYFRPDDKKAGGAYLTVRGIVKKIDEYSRIIYLQDSMAIPIEEIVEITEKNRP